MATKKSYVTLPAVHRGAVHGQWTMKHRLGVGGNGEVWAAQNDAGQEVAVKLLNKVKIVAYARFRSEVEVMTSCGVTGVVPVVDFELPDRLSDARAWYSMPIGIQLATHLRNRPLEETVKAVASIATTLADLQDQGVFHRDVKPANMLWLDNSACIGDFGLVDYPEKQDLTGDCEELGPRWTMAPEVRRFGREADPGPADVYSIAKSLWMLVMNSQKGFDGQYQPGTAISIKRASHEDFVDPLEELLVSATDHDPFSRPSMREVAERLSAWVRINNEWDERNPLEWRAAQRQLFPASVPNRAEWHDTNEIVKVLRILGQRESMNHMFLPGGGGLDLHSAKRSEGEPDYIELVANNSVLLVRPSRLMFESFGSDSQWDYFRLETEGGEPSGVYEDIHDPIREYVTELTPGVYADMSCWEDNSNEGEPLPDSARPITRYFRGAFVLFQKKSVYNFIGDTYDGRHDRVDATGFRKYVDGLRARFHARPELMSAVDSFYNH